MKPTDPLILEIRKEFSDVPFPAHCGLHAAVAMDDWITDQRALREITIQQDYMGEWWDVPKEHLLKCMMALSYFDAAGVDFYLPAYMCAIVEAPESFDIPGVRSSSWLVLSHMRPDDEDEVLREYFYDRFSNIRAGKRRACRDFLQYVASCAAYSEHARELAVEAVAHEFWSGSDTGLA